MTFIISLSVVSIAQNSSNGKTNKSTISIPSFSTPLQVSKINSFIQKQKENGSLSDEDKKHIISPLEEAVSFIEKSQQAKKELQEYQEKINNKAADLSSIKEKLKSHQPVQEINIPADASVSELQSEFSKIQSEKQQLEKQVEELTQEQTRRNNRQKELPDQIAEIKSSLEDVKQSLEVLEKKESLSSTEKALRIKLTAKKSYLSQTLETLETELKFLEAREEVLSQKLDLTRKRKKKIDERVDRWQEVLNEQRKIEAERAKEKARKEKEETEDYPSSVLELAKENFELAKQRSGEEGTSQLIEDTTSNLNTLQGQLTQLKNDFKNVRERVDAVGLTPSVGLFLRRKRAEIPSASEFERKIQKQEDRIKNLQFEILKIEERKKELEDSSKLINQYMEQIQSLSANQNRQRVREKLRSLITRQKELLTNLQEDYEILFDKLVKQSTIEKQLLSVREEYQQFIKERILWIRSADPISFLTVEHAREGTQRVLSVESCIALGNNLLADIRKHPLIYIVALLLFLLLVLSRKRFYNKLSDIGSVTFSKYADSELHTLKAFSITLILALPFPAIMFFLGYRLQLMTLPPIAQSLGSGLIGTSLVYFSLQFVHHSCAEKGLTESHFRWPSQVVDKIRTGVSRFTMWALPLILLLLTVQATDNELWKQSAGRFCLIGLMICLFFLFQSLLSPSTGILSPLLEKHPNSWLHKLRFIWYPLSFIIPLILALFSIVGYHYSAYQLSLYLTHSMWLFLGLFYLSELLIRILQVITSRVVLKKKKEELQKKREAQEQKLQKEKEELKNQQSDQDDDGDRDPSSDRHDPPSVEDIEDDFEPDTINEQTKSIVWSIFALALGLGFWFIWVDILPALNMLDKVVLWEHALSTVSDGTQGIGTVTLADLLLASAVSAVVYIISRNLSGVLEITLFQHVSVERGVRYATITLLRYFVFLFGVLIIARIMGVGWSDVQWLAAAVSVGLGFGLQEIFANFVSGLILLFERPMRVGDTITVGDISGTVTQIRMRSTTIKDWDCKELVVPNKEFITGQLMNWTLTDNVLRQVIPVGVAYGTDPQRAMDSLMVVVEEHENVLEDPSPNVIFKEFGDSALIFHLRIYVEDIQHYWTVQSSVMKRITKRFQDEEIEISFPQRDLHLRSVDAPIPVETSRQKSSSDKQPEPGKENES